MNKFILPSIKLTFLTMILFGVLYPLIITGIAYLWGPNKGKGQSIVVEGRTIGFDRIGQSFASPKYFWGRPSAVGYNAAATGGSNKGPTNPEYLATVEERITAFLASNPGVARKDVPVELVTASGGGLDPHISPVAAHIQVPRIARERGLAEESLRSLIAQHTEGPLWGLFGPSAVNVLQINLALDALKQNN